MNTNKSVQSSFISTLICLLESDTIKRLLRIQPDGQPIEEGEEHNDFNINDNNRFFYKALQGFDKEYKIPYNHGEKSISIPNSLYRITELLYISYGTTMEVFDNQDIHEHLIKFLDMIHNSLSYSIKTKIRGHVRDGRQGYIDRLHVNYYTQYAQFCRNAYSEIINHVYFGLSSSITCYNCNHKSIIFMQECTLFLSINAKNPTLKGSLDKFMTPEFIDKPNGHTCGNCHHIQHMNKQISLWKIGETMIFAINRYDNVGQSVIIPNKLDIKSYMNIHCKGHNTKYKLVTLSCAKKTSEDTHMAYSVYKNPEGKWLKYDIDNGVQPANKKIFNDVTIVLYQNVKDEEFIQLSSDMEFPVLDV
jgi:ubiquitin C-terminal hydrolase